MPAPLTLSVADQANFAAALETLLSPLEHTDLDDWRREVNRRLIALTDSESAAFDLPGPDGPRPVYSEEYTGPVPAEYVAMFKPMNERYWASERVARHGVLTKEELWSPAWEEYLRSAYRNEFLLPYRMHQAVCLGAPVHAGGVRRVAQVIILRNTPTAPPPGEREKGLLRMLLPAFRAGLDVSLRLGARCEALTGALDGLGTPLAVVDLAGRTRHQTPALTQLLAAAPERERLAAAVRAAALGVAWARTAAGLTGNPPPPPALDVATARGRYRVRATSAAEGAFGPNPVALVVVEAAAPALPSEGSLMARFGLTRQEARVALLLAARKTAAEIAEALVVSPHTARRHTERVLAKLGVHSRRDVAAALVA